MKISDLKTGDWVILKKKKYIKIESSLFAGRKAVFMGLDINNFGRFYYEDSLDEEVEFCSKWDYVNSNYNMTGKNCKSPYGSRSNLDEALDYFVCQDIDTDEVIMKRKYKDKNIYIVIWSKSLYNQGLVFPVHKYNRERQVEEYIEFHLDFDETLDKQLI